MDMVLAPSPVHHSYSLCTIRWIVSVQFWTLWSTRPVRAPRCNVPLIQFFYFGAIYIDCLFISYASTLIFFSSLFSYLSPPLLIFPLRIDPLHFQAGCFNRRLNLAWVFLCIFCLVVHFFWLVNACFCCVRCSLFPTLSQKKWPVLCWVDCHLQRLPEPGN